MPACESGRRAPERVRVAAAEQIVQGARAADVARRFGVSRSVVFRWAATYRSGGEAALRSRTPPGRAPRLGPDERSRLRERLRGLDPVDAGFDCLLWTRSMVGALVRAEFGVSLSAASVSRLLTDVDVRLDGGPDRPTAGRRDLRRWVAERCPDAERAAARLGVGPRVFAAALSADGAAVALSATTTAGATRFGVYRGGPCPAVVVDFCRRLLRDAAGPVVLVGGPQLLELRRFAAGAGGALQLFDDRGPGGG